MNSIIDQRTADQIIDRLNCNLRDLSLEYGDVVIPGGDISHELWYESSYNYYNPMGYIYCDNNVYYTDGKNNYASAEQAALDLLAPDLISDCHGVILAERAHNEAAMPDYF